MHKGKPPSSAASREELREQLQSRSSALRASSDMSGLSRTSTMSPKSPSEVWGPLAAVLTTTAGKALGISNKQLAAKAQSAGLLVRREIQRQVGSPLDPMELLEEATNSVLTPELQLSLDHKRKELEATS